MEKYKKIPVVVRAQQIKESDFTKDHPNLDHVPGVKYVPEGKYVVINTLAGRMKAYIGEYIIRGVHGELYPCKEEIFNKTYEKV